MPGVYGNIGHQRHEADCLPNGVRNGPIGQPSFVFALQIDAGYIRATPRQDGAQWIAAVASKLVVPQTPHTHAHAYVTGYNPQQGLRQQAFLASIGIGANVPVTVLSDGGEDISHACQLPSAAERILDWFGSVAISRRATIVPWFHCTFN